MVSISIRRLGIGIMALLGLVALNQWMANGANASSFPEHEIEIIVGYKPGGGADTAARLFAQELKKELGVSVVVQNITGAAGVVGMTSAYAARPDGYTMVLFNSPATEIGSLEKGVAYKVPDDFKFIGAISNDAYSIVVRADSPYQTLRDLIEATRKNPEKIPFGVTGLLSTGGIAIFKVQNLLDLKWNLIPYGSGSGATAALLGGHIQVQSAPAARQAAMVEDGELRVLAVFSKQRMQGFKALNDVPTFEEVTGKKVHASSVRGFAVNARVPEDRFNILKEAFDKITKKPEFAEKVSKKQPYCYRSSKEFTDHVAETMESVKQIKERMDKQQ